MQQFLSPHEAYRAYDLAVDPEATPPTMEQILADEGVAAFEMPLSPNDFQQLSQGYAVCLQECPELLDQTASVLDERFGGEVGHARRERRIDSAIQLQTSDPKSLFHFSENIRKDWQERFARGPKVLQDFLADGFEVQDTLITVARERIAELNATHRNIDRLYFSDPDGSLATHTFMRLVRYDGYDVRGNLGEVAKSHYDIGGVTLQAYADAQGFWGAVDGMEGEKRYLDTQDGSGYMFFGKGHESMYGQDRLRPLWHGVDRIIPAGVTFVPDRTAVILFVDAPAVDYGLSRRDTVPYDPTTL